MKKPSDLYTDVIEEFVTEENLPRSDLSRLDDEVLSRSPEAALPCNIPDEWLDMIARDLEETVGNGQHAGDGSGLYASAPLALILTLLRGKENKIPEEPSPDDMLRMFTELRFEINLEIVRRRLALQIEPATLQTIFTESRMSR